MQISIRFFAILKERAGVSELTVELASGATVSDALEFLTRQFPAIATDLSRSAVAINRQYSRSDEPLQHGDELALIPPVSGG